MMKDFLKKHIIYITSYFENMSILILTKEFKYLKPFFMINYQFELEDIACCAEKISKMKCMHVIHFCILQFILNQKWAYKVTVFYF